MSDPTLQSARRGDLPAINRLVRQHQDMVYNLAYRLLGDETAAAIATEAAFVTAMRELRGYRAGPFGVWVLRWLVQACQPGLVRSYAHSAAVAAPAGAAGQSPVPLAHCLAALPPPQRLVVALVDIAGLDYTQAAAVLGQAPAQLTRDLAAARRALSTASR
jgi:RNA polymerase sigma-70 factor (ECF subfamily)